MNYKLPAVELALSRSSNTGGRITSAFPSGTFALILLVVLLLSAALSPRLSFGQTIAGVVVNEQNQLVRDPVLVKLVEPETNSLITSEWSSDSSYFELNPGDAARVRLVASRFGTTATYTVQTIVVRQKFGASFVVVLPEPVKEAIPTSPSNRYHDKNRALAEGMLASGRVRIVGSDQHSVFDAEPAAAVVRIRSRRNRRSLAIRLNPVGIDGQLLAGPIAEQSCSPDRACYIQSQPAEYQLELLDATNNRIQRLGVTLVPGLTTVWIDGE